MDKDKEKHHIPHAREAKNADGSYNLDHIEAAATKALQNLRHGHAKILNFEEAVPPGGVGRRFILDVEGH